MSAEVENLQEPRPAAGSGSGENFVRRRKLSRAMAMQHLYACDVTECWEAPPEDAKAEYLELAKALALDEEYGYSPSLEDVREAWKYAMKLVNGVLECRDELDELISGAAINWKISRMGSIDRAILRIALYEMLKVEKVKPATAIDEAVELAKTYGQGDSPRFVNGILDKIRRTRCNSADEARKQE